MVGLQVTLLQMLGAVAVEVLLLLVLTEHLQQVGMVVLVLQVALQAHP